MSILIVKHLEHCIVDFMLYENILSLLYYHYYYGD